jgi:hypothetical protein
MTCKEFQEILPDIMEGGQTVEQEAHGKSCLACSSLLSDLTYISQQARTLRETDDPSPRVWNSIELALREQGLIRTSQDGLMVVPAPTRSWRMGWLAPLAATLIVGFGAADYYMASKKQGQVQMAVVSQIPSAPNAEDAEDAQLLETISQRAPAMRATYEANLQDVNAYIRDAAASAEKDPSDEEAQQALMDAYAQKNMVYEMALDRSLR